MFSVIVPGRPCLTESVAVDAQPNGQATKFAFTFPSHPTFSDIAVFFLPGTVLPQDTAAALYIQLPDPNSPTGGGEFRFIGALANENPSNIFKVRSSESSSGPRRTEADEEDEMLDEGTSNVTGGSVPNGMVTLGISIEPLQTVAPQLAALEAEKPRGETTTDLVRQAPEQRQEKEVTTKVLAQRIIGNAFNFLASFGDDTVPLKSFRDWWTKFERRVAMDPTFLEREDPNATG
ncbi:hypothetical protein ASPWEDRAFT_38808 [Aspergillus wentii DTO 134E9]|uniref:Uncharacterized protein n=1 Tax=Aspergillus wentii DTO 134E9 TaxID=1073089 RepID=A0A1L9RQK0_ASPWE|nr:uncharacterized protein ASPWEDRAFT_38808 [Aspergillus wentii DTO 134E9]KAI9928362.1 hypothetical protein MW887_002400 [Aspergillus wentii]OJJ37153.1 hypothetical protein ASPWEDRAFT_38808 [Aspergillus wentii DTO 134E9]